MSSELNVYLTFITFYVCLLQKTKARWLRLNNFQSK
jgi:hypothetical protein